MVFARPNERDATFSAGGGKIGSLRQKTVSRMDRITPIRFGHIQDGFSIQIGTCTNPGEARGFVGDSSVQTLLIVLGKCRHRIYPQISGRSSYTYRNFTTISDQQSLYRHVGSTSPKELAILARNEERRIRCAGSVSTLRSYNSHWIKPHFAASSFTLPCLLS